MSMNAELPLHRSTDKLIAIPPTNYIFICLAIVFVGLVAGLETLIILSSITSIGLLIAGLRAPSAALFGVMILCVIDPVTRVLVLNSGVSPLLRWNTFNYILALYAFAYLPLLLRLRMPQIALLKTLMFIFVLSIVVTENLVSAISQILLPLSYLGIMAICARVNLENRIWKGPIAVTSFLGVTISILMQSQMTISIDHNALIHINIGGAILALVGYMLAVQNSGRYAIYIVLVISNCTLSLIIGSRGGILLSTIIVIGLLLQMDIFKRASRLLLSIVAAISFVLILATVFPDQYNDTVTRLTKTLNSSDFTLVQRTSARSDIALGAWYVFISKPILGAGTGNFPTEWARLGTLDGLLTTVQVGDEKAAHGAWFLVMAENGTVGLTILILWVLSFGRVKMDNLHPSTKLFAITTTVLFAANFFHAGFQSKAFGFLFAFCTLLSHHTAIRNALKVPYSLKPRV